MAQVDVSELLHDSIFLDTMSLVTRTPTVNSFGENLVGEVTVVSYGSIQPASGKTLARLPEALRLSDVSEFYFYGNIVASTATNYPSVLVFKGKRYQVQTVQDFGNWGAGYSVGTCIAELPS